MIGRKLTQVLLVSGLALGAAASPLWAAPLPFTYQGQLKLMGAPITSRANFVFDLYDAEVDGTRLDQVELLEVPVVNGLFTVDLLFERAEFNGDPRWLEIYVRTEMGESVLRPRQPVFPTPLAMTALETVGVDGHSLDAVDGNPVDAVYVDATGLVNMDRGGLSVNDRAGHGISLASDSFAFSEGRTGNPIYDYTSETGIHTFWTEARPSLRIGGDGNVGIGVEAANHKLQVAGTVGMTGFHLPTGATAGHVLTSDATGVGTWQVPPAGGGTTPWESGHNFIYYNSGYVGIGTDNPLFTLDVAGPINIGGFKMGTRTTAGHVLTVDTAGVGRWTAPPQAADPVWGQTGSDIYYEGQVGIGTTNPQHTLEVVGSDAALVKAYNNSAVGEFAAVQGECDSPDCRAIKGVAASLTGDPAGVFGQSASPNGMGVFGRNLSGGYAVYGMGQSDTSGWAGYFSGQGYFSGNVGIGRTTPTAKLDVNGTVKMTGLQLGTSATTGHVLTANSSGVATWQAPSGGGDFTLPVQETVDVDDASAFSITNTGTGISTNAIRGVISNSGSNDASAAYFGVQGPGTAVHASNDSGSSTIYATNSSTGKVIYASSTGGSGGEFRSSKVGGFGVKGLASNSAANVDTTGGWFESSGSSGKAVYAKATGAQATGVYIETTGGESYAVHAQSPYYGMYVSGGVTAARFYGEVSVKSRTSNTTVFEVGNDGITAVDVLQINGGSDLAENFDVTEPAKPGMVVEIDPDQVGKLRVARGAYNHRVAGVISGANDVDPGMVLADLPGAENSMPVALTGRVWVYCDAVTAPIVPGDLLTTSDRPGHAMKALDHGRAQGAVIGKAMSKLDQGETGMVLALVNLQ